MNLEENMQILKTAVFLVSAVFFMVGMHGIDQAWNLKTVNARYGADYYETSYLLAFDEEQLYKNSLMIALGGFLAAVMSGAWLSSPCNRSARRLSSPQGRRVSRARTCAC